MVRYQDDSSEVWPLADVSKALTCTHSYVREGGSGAEKKVDWKLQEAWSCRNPGHICARLRIAKSSPTIATCTQKQKQKLGDDADTSPGTVVAVLVGFRNFSETS